MDWSSGLLVLFWLSLSRIPEIYGYKIGVGIADITGPPAEVAFMGYANPEQKGGGLHLRQFSRAFIIEDGSSRMVFVSADCGMMGTFLRKEVLRRLQSKLGNLYTIDNVMLSGTHTHSTPGGFLMDLLFDLNSWGFVPETFEAYASGITRSILRAHGRMVQGDVQYSRGEIQMANINRSPTSYLRNPPEERARYASDVDKTFSQLKFFRKDGLPLGVITWFAVHPTSMNNTNKLVSSDNVGLASIMFEQRVNKEFTNLIGKGPFVAAFASSNLGDVSPNIAGPRCVLSGGPCDAYTSSCPDKKDKCIAFGPGRDMFESTHIIATRIMESAWDTWKSKGQLLNGKVSVVHQYVDMPSRNVPYRNPKTGEVSMVRGCSPAMGYSFAAGTTDGPGAFSFKQGTTTTNPLWNALTDLLAEPTPELIACHAPKPILLATGLMNFPVQWQPAIVSTQLGQIGPIKIACVPGEFTTMSGRRLRKMLAEATAVSPEQVIVAGLCNTYSDYITTPEEYQAQRYEAASTIYGPYTLPIYINQYKALAGHLKYGTKPDPGPDPPESFSDLVSLLPPVIWDMAGWGKQFGDVISQPREEARPGETVSAVFVSGHPRNNFQTEGTYLTVEKLGKDDKWDVVATDANWETRFIWTRGSKILGTSTAEVRWDIPLETKPGMYRIRHFGHFKNFLSSITPYEGTSMPFKVVR
ncbi:unnamed protein product [Nezara viridula]|uniref:Neutral ceramidase n=1 Tax=Nezara viridula TaxID=85310 RepID=A0A9P0HPK5_NEZVI|nr:unnamed protein product [Nezara viridula]